MLGLFGATQSGIAGSILQMVNHGISTGLLFLLVGMIYERRHSRALDAFGGVATVMPVFAVFWVFTVLSSVGLPGLNGFVGEYLVLLGAFQANPFWSVVGLSGVIFGAVYMLMATRKMLFGACTNPENKKLTDLGGREMALMVPLVVLAVWLGLRPGDFTSKVEPSLAQVQQRILEARQRNATASLGLDTPGTAAATVPATNSGAEGVAAR